MSRIGLVAGYGKLPAVFARSAKARGESLVGFGIRGLTDEGIVPYVDKMHWLEWGGLQKAIMFAMLDRVKRVVMLGKIDKSLAFAKDEALDADARKILSGKGGKKDYSILREVEGLLKKIGISIIDPTPYLEELVPRAGTLTRREPSESEWADIRYGRDIARALAGYDIGQTLAVKDKTIIAIEAVEGTDETIKRAGAMGTGGFSVVKMARPHQDMRFDVPLIGLGTLQAVINAKGTALSLEAGKTYLTEREEMVKLADENGVAVVVIE